MLTDTSPEIDRLQIERLRQATPSERLATARRQSRLVIGMARQAIQRVHPDWTQDQVDIEYVRVHYGDQLARLFRQGREADA